MKIKVEFTVDVPRESLVALRLLSGEETNAEAAEFVRLEARDSLADYLGSNGVNGVTITERWERAR